MIDVMRTEVRVIVQQELDARYGQSREDWIDQRRSPLGRKMHCALVRRGELPGISVHRRVLVRRRDLDAYIESHARATQADQEARAFARSGARRVTS